MPNTVPTATQRLQTLCTELRSLAADADLGDYVGHRVRELVDEAQAGEPANPVTRAVVDSLRVLTDGDIPTAVAVLKAARTTLLTDREYAEVLGWLGQRRRKCLNCHGLLLFVADGPDPGRWSHDLVPDEEHPCRGAVPEVTR